MKKSKEEFQTFAESLYEDINQAERPKQVLQLLRERDEFFAEISDEQFAQEFISAQLGLCCLFWERLCAIHEIEIEEISKAMLLVVMASFESPDKIEPAKAFSEYLCGDEQGHGLAPGTAMAQKIYERLHLQKALKDLQGNPKLTAGFQTLVEVFEAFRCTVEAKFEEFVEPIGD